MTSQCSACGCIEAGDHELLATGGLYHPRWYARHVHAEPVLCPGSTALGSGYGFALRIWHPFGRFRASAVLGQVLSGRDVLRHLRP